MATAFGSVSQTSGDVQDVTIPKPTGLAEGDFMLAVLVNLEENTNYTLSGWTAIEDYDDGTQLNLTLLWKVATAADASASDFTFDNSNAVTQVQGGFIMRITGGSFTGAGNYIAASVLKKTGLATGVAGVVSNGLTPPGDNGLLILGAAAKGDPISAAGDYSVANNDPTWTERVEEIIDETDADGGLAVATGTYAALTATGDGSLSFSFPSSVNAYGFMVAVKEDTNASVTGTTGTIQVAGNAGTATGDANVTGVTGTIQVSGNAGTVTGVDAKWTNKDKSSAPSVTNKDKS